MFDSRVIAVESRGMGDVVDGFELVGFCEVAASVVDQGDLGMFAHV
jgi:hypothetical protein